MRILVTGGCGFIGSAVVRMALERGDRVLAIDRRRKSAPVPALSPVLHREGYARLEADVADRALMRALMREFAPERIIHLASGEGDDAGKLFESDIAGGFSVVEAVSAWRDAAPADLREAIRLIHVASARPQTDPAAGRIRVMQAAGADLIARWSQASGLAVVTCLVDEVFGPWQPASSLLARLLASLMHGQTFTLPDSGESVRDWLPVRDLASGLLAAADAADPANRIAFSVGAERRDCDIAEAICSLLETQLAGPAGQAWPDLIETSGTARNALLGPGIDEADAERLTGWRPHGFHAGLERLVTWTVASYEAARQRTRAPAAV